ncbi:glycosyl hydrolase [Marisediminicola sp. LYQ85]|uniref:glycosyl hydrolase n=1 Tax=Marisediminicola sp. LYQ85 TaxID=3391062 RepID=UPI003983C5B5
MSTSEKAAHWWAPTSTRARLTTVGAIILVGGLVTTSVIVWNSPSNPVADVITATISGVSVVDRLESEREELLAEVATLNMDLARSDEDLAAAEDRFDEIQQELWSAEGLIAAMERSRSTDPESGQSPPSTRPPFANPSPSPSPSPSDPATPTPSPTTPGSPQIPTAPLTNLTKARLVDPSSAYLGLYTEQAPFNWATFDRAADRIEAEPDVVGYFGGWDEDFRANAVTRAWEQDRLPILTWESRPIGSPNSVTIEPEYSLPRILGDPDAGVPGAFDDYLRQYAQDIVATGLPMGIRLNHEMNGTWYPWSESDSSGNSINGNRPGDYVKTWQHVHDIFEAEGANDLVFWIWSPNRIDRLPASLRDSEHLDSLYPGDDYVDWVAMSAYLRPPFDNPDGYDFDETFSATLGELRRVSDKPIFLAEIGASEVGGHKADWISSLFDNLVKPENDDILGVAWFNLAVTTYVQGELATNDWRVDSRPESLTAFREGFARATDKFTD